jgi:IclR family mhp operon transcriptional activator
MWMIMGDLQTLARGLNALALINAHGPVTLAELARHLDLPRPNVDRILQTLVSQGYCARLPNSTRYAMTLKVRRLSNGLRDGALLTAAALPIMDALERTIEWPVALAVPTGAEMTVLLSTDMATPLALLKTRPGYRTPILQTTTGLLYLAFLSETVRATQMPALIRASTINPALSEATLADAFSFARQHRYLLLDHGFPEASLGVPLLYDGTPLGGLVVRYLVRGISKIEATARFLPMLREAAAAIIGAIKQDERVD